MDATTELGHRWFRRHGRGAPAAAARALTLGARDTSPAGGVRSARRRSGHDRWCRIAELAVIGRVGSTWFSS
jgi:hypothetical protein